MSDVLKHCNCDDRSNNPVEPTEDVYKRDSTDDPLKHGEDVETVPVRKRVEAPEEHAVLPETDRDKKTGEDRIVHVVADAS